MNDKLNYMLVLLLGSLLFFSAAGAQLDESCEDICVHPELNIPYEECIALATLYATTDGPSWTLNTNRTTSPDVTSRWGVVLTTGSGIRNVQEIILPTNNISGALPAALQSLTSLTRLNLHANQITELPSSFATLTQLEELIVSDNQLTTLPDIFTNRGSLDLLRAEGNQISSLPASLGNLYELDLLDVSNNVLTSLPTSIGNLDDLDILKVAHNQLTVLPNPISDLDQLSLLDAQGNYLTVWPAQIAQLITLESLQLQDNAFTTVPAEVFSLPSLHHLNLRNNALTVLPDGWEGSSALQIIDLGANRLTVLPASIGTLDSLTQLYLQENRLPGIAEQIMDLSTLQLLHLGFNLLTGLLPDSLAALESLTYLDVSYNALDHTAEGDALIPVSLTQRVSRSGFVFHGEGQQGDTDNRVTILEQEPFLPTSSSVITRTISLTPSIRMSLSNEQQPTVVIAGTGALCSQLEGSLTLHASGSYELTLEPQTQGVYAGCTLQLVDQWGELTQAREIPSLTIVTEAQETFCDDPAVTIERDACIALLQLFVATDGPNRTNSAGWFLHPRVEERYGIETSAGDEKRNVIGIYLHTNNRQPGASPLQGAGNGLSGGLPDIFASLPDLRTLALGNNDLAGELPSSLGQLDTLQFLYLQNNEFTGPIDIIVSELPALRRISVQQNNFSGPLEDAFASLPNLETVDIRENSFSGPLPLFAAQAPIFYLNAANNDFDGSLPASWSAYTTRQHVYLQGNEISGTLPLSRGTWSGVRQIDLSNNVLQRAPDKSAVLDASLLSWWQGLTQKTRANQRDIQAPVIELVGTWTTTGASSYAITIAVSENNYAVDALGVGMPIIFAGGAGCDELIATSVMVSTGQSTVTVTPPGAGIFEDCTMTLLDHGENYSNTLMLPLLGHDLGEQSICLHPDLSIPVDECRALRELYTATNGEERTNKNNWWQSPQVDTWFGIQTRVVDGQEHVAALLLHRNELTSLNDPLVPQSRGNNLQGLLPRALRDLRYLTHFRADHNSLSGSPRDAIVGMEDIEVITLSENDFSEGLPVHRGGFTKLTTLNLTDNSFIGSVPQSWKGLSDLTVLRVAENELSGTIEVAPSDRGSLEYVDISHNQFSGSLDADWSFQLGLKEFFVQNNAFGGSVPSTWSALTGLTKLDLAENLLTGPFPVSLQSWSLLEEFSASGNAIYGDINTVFPYRSSLKKLDVTANKFTGRLQSSRTNLEQLEVLSGARNYLDRTTTHEAILSATVATRLEDAVTYDLSEQIDMTAPVLSSPTTIFSPVGAQILYRLQREENSYPVTPSGTGLLLSVGGAGLCSSLLIDVAQIATGGNYTGTIDITLAPLTGGVYTCRLNLLDHGGNVGRLLITPFLYIPTCGNGAIDFLEECDEGRFCDDMQSCTDDFLLCPFECQTRFVDGCNPACTPSLCGDGYVDTIGQDNLPGTNDDETCDPGKFCADGRVCTHDPSICRTGSAECQPMPTADCSPYCKSLSCGDGYLDVGAGETCDDGNLVSGDGCNNVCLSEVCGDGIVDANGADNIAGTEDDEACDLGINNGLFGGLCDASCAVPDPSCMACRQYCHEVLESGTGDHAIYLVIDRTGSMNGQQRLANAQAAGEEFISLLPGVDWSGAIVQEGSLVGVVTFANGADLEITHTDDYTGAIEALFDIQASANADMSAGITLAKQQLAQRTEQNKWIVLLSDGSPTRPQGKNNAAESAVNAADEAKGEGIKIFSVGLQQGVKGRELLQDISSGTGYYYEDPTNEVLTEIYQIIYGKIHCGCGDELYCSTCGDGEVLFNEQCDEGSFCDDGRDCSINAGICPSECRPRTSQTCTQLCQLPSCGDGVVQTGLNEQCDDGNVKVGDGCSPTCQIEVCGDGVVDVNGADNILGTADDEQCDDGNGINGDGCSSTCKSEFCGDGILLDDEVCDTGRSCDDGTDCTDNPWICPGQCQTRFTEGCAPDCTYGYCGDLLVDEDGENNLAGDTDDEQCDPGKFCPNGIPCSHDESLCPGACEVTFTPTCTEHCKLTYCGDGFVDLDGVDDLLETIHDNEQCDDENGINGDGCSSTCLLESLGGCIGEECGITCGDGTKQFFEPCDPTDLTDVNKNICTDNCTISICGDGILFSGEQCDIGKWCSDGVTSCTHDATICPTGPSECLARYVQGCTEVCTLGCGDGVIQPAGRDGLLGTTDDEQCDDGNTRQTDSCTNTCKSPVCGDGIVTYYAQIPSVTGGTQVYYETCDDGNTEDGDDCPATCIGSGVAMTGQCSDAITSYSLYDVTNFSFDDITQFCETGIPDGSPIYDEENKQRTWVCHGVLGGASDSCALSSRSCGDGVVDVWSDEESGRTIQEACDDGNMLDGDGCTALCQVESPILFGETQTCSSTYYPTIQSRELLPLRWEGTVTEDFTGSCAAATTNMLIDKENMRCKFSISRGHADGYTEQVGHLETACLNDLATMTGGVLIRDALLDQGGNPEQILGATQVTPVQINEWGTDESGIFQYGQYRLDLVEITFPYCALTRTNTGGVVTTTRETLSRTFTSTSVCAGKWSVVPGYMMQQQVLFSEQPNTGLDLAITNLSGEQLYLTDSSYDQSERLVQYTGPEKSYLFDEIIEKYRPLALDEYTVATENDSLTTFKKVPNSHVYVYTEQHDLILEREQIEYLLMQAGVSSTQTTLTPFTIIVPDYRAELHLVGDIPGRGMYVARDTIRFIAQDCDQHDVVQGLFVTNAEFHTTATINDDAEAGARCNRGSLRIEGLLLGGDISATLGNVRRATLNLRENEQQRYADPSNMSYLAHNVYHTCYDLPLLYDTYKGIADQTTIPTYGEPFPGCSLATSMDNEYQEKYHTEMRNLFDLLLSPDGFLQKAVNEQNSPFSTTLVKLLEDNAMSGQPQVSATGTLMTVFTYDDTAYTIMIPSWKMQQITTLGKSLPSFWGTSVDLNDGQIRKQFLAWLRTLVGPVDLLMQEIVHPLDGVPSLHQLLENQWGNNYTQTLLEQVDAMNEAFCTTQFQGSDNRVYTTQKDCLLTYAPVYRRMITSTNAYKSQKIEKDQEILDSAGVQIRSAPFLRQSPPPGARDLLQAMQISF